MNETRLNSIRGIVGTRWAAFAVKALVLVGVLFLVARNAAVLPSACLAALWGMLSIASAIWLEYHHVVRKTHRQAMLQEGGRLSQLNRGRILGLIGFFALSAACMVGLMLESPRWNAAAWAVILLAIPLFPLVNIGVGRLLQREYKPLYRASRTGLASCAIVGGVLCAVYLAFVAIQPAVSYENATQAFLATPNPFQGSPSALLSEAGKLVALVDGFVAYALGKAAVASAGGYLVAQVALIASAFFGVASLLGFCSAGWTELKRVFLPLPDNPDADDDAAGTGTIIRRVAVVAAALPVCLFALFMAADSQAARAVESPEYTAAESFIRDQVGQAVFILDGKYYQVQAVEQLLKDTQAQSDALAQEARDTMIPLINASCDARLANVDAYLDWYYSLPADYERLANMVTGNVENYVEGQFSERISQGIDDSQLDEAKARFDEQLASLKSQFADQLAQLQTVDVPEWLYVEKTPIEADSLSIAFEPARTFADDVARLGISAGAGLAAGIVAKRVVGKAMAKPFFSKIVQRIATVLAARGGITAVGGAAGTLAGPLGTAAGLAAGAAVGVGVDYAWLKADEALNRDEYRQEIVDSIEESRAEMIAAISGTTSEKE